MAFGGRLLADAPSPDLIGSKRARPSFVVLALRGWTRGRGGWNYVAMTRKFSDSSRF